MIVVEMMAGLANRMFQFAFYLSLKEKGHMALIDDTYQASKWKFEDVSLQKIFPNIEFERADIKLINKLGGGDDIISKVRRKYAFLSKKSYVLYNVADGYKDDFYKLDRDLYLSGNWISELYFKEIQDKIKENFIFSNFTDEKNIKIAKEMQECNSVAIHVRKGADYDNSVNSGVCDASYYQRCINLISKHINSPKYYIFSDNPQWVKNNFNFIEYTFVDWNPTTGFGNHFDMQLMSKAKHNIIANSTYSWWGAWLNTNPKKTVLAPLTWFNKDCIPKSSIELSFIPETWIAL